MVRYADDIVACFQNKEEATKFAEELKERLGKFNLELSEEKTKTVEFGRYATRNRKTRGERKPETFDFLGFTHYCSTNRNNGKYRVKRKTSKKKFQAKVAIMKEWIHKNMHMPVKILINKLNVKLRGHYNYYGISDNITSIRNFYETTIHTLYKRINRRSQKNKYSWEKFYNIIKDKIIRPTIKVDIVSRSLKIS